MLWDGDTQRQRCAQAGRARRPDPQRQVAHRSPHRRRRDGDSLRGHAPQRAPRGDQGAAPELHGQSGGRPSISARGICRQQDRSPRGARHPGRRGRGGWIAVPGHGAARGGVAVGAPCADRRQAAVYRDGGHHRAGARGPRYGARERHRSSGRQAGKHLRDQDRAREAARFRAGSRPGRRRAGAPDAGRYRHGYRGLPRARAGARLA